MAGKSTEQLRPNVVIAVDPAMLTVEDGCLHVVLWKRAHWPHTGMWALPGVLYVWPESLEGAARRGLHAKAGLEHVPWLEQAFTWDHADRDERGAVVVVAYYSLAPAEKLRRAIASRHDVCLARVDVPWSGERGGRVRLFDDKKQRIEVAFDHDEVLGAIVKRLRGRLGYTADLLHALPKRFTLRDLQDVYEGVRGATVNKDSFRRSVTKSKLVVPTREFTEIGRGRRVAELYTAGPKFRVSR